MSRSGYNDDFCGNDFYGNEANLYRANVDRTINGKVGQKFLRELVEALDALPVKELIAHSLVDVNCRPCALGAVALKRGHKVSKTSFSDCYSMANLFKISVPLAAEIMYENDEAGWDTTIPKERFRHMRKWAVSHLKQEVV